MLRSIRLIHGSHGYDGRIRNISDGGALIEGLADVPEGTIFQISFGGSYSVEAVCRWSSQDRMGVEFTVPVQFDRINGETVVPDARGGAVVGQGNIIRRKVA